MPDITKIDRNKRVIILEENLPDLDMYLDMFAPLITICRIHDAKLDLTAPRKPMILGATAKCRKRIRRAYGTGVQRERVGKILYLRGF